MLIPARARTRTCPHSFPPGLVCTHPGSFVAARTRIHSFVAACVRTHPRSYPPALVRARIRSLLGLFVAASARTRPCLYMPALVPSWARSTRRGGRRERRRRCWWWQWWLQPLVHAAPTLVVAFGYTICCHQLVPNTHCTYLSCLSLILWANNT